MTYIMESPYKLAPWAVIIALCCANVISTALGLSFNLDESPSKNSISDDANDPVKSTSSPRARRHPPPSPSAYFDEKLVAYVGRTLILKLNRNDFLQDMISDGRGLESDVNNDPVEFFPSLDGKPRLVYDFARSP